MSKELREEIFSFMGLTLIIAGLWLFLAVFDGGYMFPENNVFGTDNTQVISLRK